jgi:hypothetical protein
MAAKYPKFGDLSIDASALYLLARPSTADDIRENVHGPSLPHGHDTICKRCSGPRRP